MTGWYAEHWIVFWGLFCWVMGYALGYKHGLKDGDGNLVSNCYGCPMNPDSDAWMR